MNRSFAQSLRLPVALAAAATLAACGGTVDFDVSKSFDVNVTSGTSWSGTKAVDLATDNGAAWKQRKHIDSIEVVSADATITAVTAPPNVAATGSGTAWFRPDGATTASTDVLVGTWSGNVAVGSTVDLTPSPALSAFITDVLKGSGKFTVVATGTVNNVPAVFTVKVSVACKLNWKPF
jgi:hypothetical protein